jgi:membrane protein
MDGGAARIGRRAADWRRQRARWIGVARRVGSRLKSHRTTLVAAGCAFYATLALFPAVSTLVSLYGLAFDPRDVEFQLDQLAGVLPEDAFQLIRRGLHVLLWRRRETLGLNFAVGATITLWSSTIGTRSLLAALNLAYDEEERRGLLRFQATASPSRLPARWRRSSPWRPWSACQRRSICSACRGTRKA